MEDLKQLARESIVMLEKYYDEARSLPNNNTKVLELRGKDAEDWKNTYYPQLVQSGAVRDGLFFQNPIVNQNYGIGADAHCTKYEYVQYLWSAYKYVLTDFTANTGVRYIKECIDMLEPYAKQFENHLTETSKVCTLNGGDVNKWKYEYYPYFSKSGLIPDGQFFGDVHKDPRLGVGNDGAFAGEELCHFLYQLYKFADVVINRNVPVWKIQYLLCKQTTFDGVVVRLSDKDIADMNDAIRRFQNFVFCYSKGNVAIEIIKKELEYSVQLHKAADDDYYIDIFELPNGDGSKYIDENIADACIVYARFGKFPTRWLAVTFNGKGAHNFSYINLKGLENVPNDRYLEPSDNYPFPEEVAVHEFCHVLQYVLQDLFKQNGQVNPDSAEKYGYKNETPNAPIGGFYSFYQDILSGNVKDSDGKLIGVKPEMWKYTMRAYNAKS